MSATYRSTICGDYATCRAGMFNFYVGYERTLCSHGEDAKCGCDEHVWCFVASVNGHEVQRITVDDLNYNGEDMAEILLRGISAFFGG